MAAGSKYKLLDQNFLNVMGISNYDYALNFNAAEIEKGITKHPDYQIKTERLRDRDQKIN